MFGGKLTSTEFLFTAFKTHYIVKAHYVTLENKS